MLHKKLYATVLIVLTLAQSLGVTTAFAQEPNQNKHSVGIQDEPDAKKLWNPDIDGFHIFTNTAEISNTAINANLTNNETPVAADTSPLLISEIMYDNGLVFPESDWEWIEIYNSGSTTINLAGYVLDDNNSDPHSSANIASGSVLPGKTAILFNSTAITASDFEAAWGAGINLIAVTGWSNLKLNNEGDRIGLWSSFANYSGDHLDHNNTITGVAYGVSSPWPVPNGKASIYLTDLSTDPTDGSNWDLSQQGGATPIFTGYQSAAAGGNSGIDIGSPGPSSNVIINKAVNAGVVAPGDTITYTLTFTNSGGYTAGGVVITDLVPITVTNVKVISSGVNITQTNVGVYFYTWSTQDLDTGMGGVITITGTIDPNLAGGEIFTNTATITTSTFDTNTANNSSRIGVVVEEQSTAITLTTFSARPGEGVITVTWETGTEIDNAGFNVHRATAKAGPFIKINPTLIPAKGSVEAGATYSYLDSAAIDPNAVYYYKLEDIDLSGVSTFHGPVNTYPDLSGGPGGNQYYLPIIIKF